MLLMFSFILFFLFVIIAAIEIHTVLNFQLYILRFMKYSPLTDGWMDLRRTDGQRRLTKKVPLALFGYGTIKRFSAEYLYERKIIFLSVLIQIIFKKYNFRMLSV